MQDLTKKNILKLKQSSTLVINEKCKKLINQGKKVYQFGFGQSPFPVPEKIVNALKDNAHRKEYLPIQGLAKLRESISKNLKKKIERYFGDGTKFGANITYIKENKPLGTAGSLHLLKNSNKLPIVVVNGDTVTDVNFKSLINYHKKNSSHFTIVTNLERKKRPLKIIIKDDCCR